MADLLPLLFSSPDHPELISMGEPVQVTTVAVTAEHHSKVIMPCASANLARIHSIVFRRESCLFKAVQVLTFLSVISIWKSGIVRLAKQQERSYEETKAPAG